jgi:hypothetical protein
MVSYLVLGFYISPCSQENLHSGSVTVPRGMHKRCEAIKLFSERDTHTMQEEQQIDRS